MSDIPEAKTRQNIDAQLAACGWEVQNREEANITASLGVAIREFPLEHGHGYADYLLYADGKATGVVEAKKEGHTLSGVEVQSQEYGEGLPGNLPAYHRPLPFQHQSGRAMVKGLLSPCACVVCGVASHVFLRLSEPRP